MITTQARDRIVAATPAVAAALVFGLIILLVVMNSALLDRLAKLRSGPRDNVQWALMQVQNESARMQLAVTEALLTGDVRQAEVAKRFDILYSRFDMIENAPMFESLRQKPAFRDQITHGRADLDRMAALVDSSDDRLETILPQLKAGAKPFQSDMQEMVLGAIQQFAAASDAERTGLSDFIKQMGIAAALLVLVLILAVVLLQIQSRKLQRREAALVESRNLMAATSSVSLDAIVVTDKNGRILEFNPAAEQCLGRTKAEALGADMAALVIPSRYREAHRKGMERFLATGQTGVIGKRIEIEALHAKGHDFPVELAVGMAKTQDGPVFIAHMRDITQRKADEAALRSALEDAKEGLHTKERFLAIISHEIRTPLNGVIGVMDVLRDTALTPTQAHYVKIAQQSGEALLGIISDILDISKMNASGVELRPDTVNLGEILREAIETTSAGAAAKENAVTVVVDDDLPEAVVADGSRLRQVMLNLLSNAQKFTQAGRIDVSLTASRQTAGSVLVEFSVVDTGVGFDPDSAERLFRDFTTLDASYQRQTGGSGLGLAISRRIIEAMGGNIGAEGQPGRGSRFWFRVRLPVADGMVRIPEKPVRGANRSLHVLVAEDNATNLMVTRQMLEAAGHRVDVARDGADAVERAGTSRYDVILMDISMPGMDGIEATSIIRAKGGPSSSTPIIALTANAMREGADQALAAGMNGYLSKPVGRAELMAAVDRIIEEGSHCMNHPLFDEAHYAQLCADITPQSAQEVLQTFLCELADRQTEMSRAHARGDGPGFGKICHAIAGAASMVGAASLAAIASEADGMSKEGRAEAALATFCELETIIARTRDVLATRAAA